MGKNCIYLQNMEIYFFLIPSSEHTFFDYVLLRPSIFFFLLDPPSPPSLPQDDARDDGPMHRASPSSSKKG